MRNERPHRFGAHRGVRRRRRLPGAEPRPEGDDAAGRRQGDRTQRSARPRRGRLSHRPQVGDGREDAGQAEVRRLQRRRGRSRRLHGSQRHGERPAPRPGGHGHRRLRRRRQPGLRLRPRRISRGGGPAAQGDPAGAASRRPRYRHFRDALRLPRGRAHRRRGLRLRRGDGADGLHRGQARPTAPASAIPRRTGLVGVANAHQQRRDVRQRRQRSSIAGPTGSPPSARRRARGQRSSR